MCSLLEKCGIVMSLSSSSVILRSGYWRTENSERCPNDSSDASDKKESGRCIEKRAKKRAKTRI
jgi:hypothetical protein